MSQFYEMTCLFEADNGQSPVCCSSSSSSSTKLINSRPTEKVILIPVLTVSKAYSKTLDQRVNAVPLWAYLCEHLLSTVLG